MNKVPILMDKKIREHRIEHENTIFLDDVVFDNLDQVEIIWKNENLKYYIVSTFCPNGAAKVHIYLT